MADEVVLEFAVLNIVADPHRDGVYPKIVSVPLTGFASVLGAAKSVARNTVLRLRGRRAEPN